MSIHFKINYFNYQRADNKIFACKFSKNVKSKLYHTEKSKTRGKTHYEPPHQDLHCLEIKLFLFTVLKMLKTLIQR